MLPLLFFAAATPALAGDGPWTLDAGASSLYVGSSYFRYSGYLDGGGQEVTIDEGVTATGLVLVNTRGLIEGLELELVLPYERVRVNDPEGSRCVDPARPEDYCKLTSGIGDLSAVLKARLVDELYGPPLTVAAAIGVRSGELYSERRGRLTSLGDGQTDAGVGLSAGRTSSVFGDGWYRVGAWGWYWYRFPNQVQGGRKLPADEVSYTLEAMLAPGPRVGFGPALQGFHRLDGVDVSDVNLGSLNGWNALRAAQVQAGGKVGVFPERGPSLSLGIFRAVYAQNNPLDTLVVSAGLGWYQAEGWRRGQD